MTTDNEDVSKPAAFDKTQAKTAVKALLSHIAKRKSNSLFPDAPTRFLLDIQTFKTPSGVHEYYNIVLPNSPFPDPVESLDVVLVVRDKKDTEPEHVIGEIKDELMESCKKDEIKVRQIMTLKQLKDDYSTFEAKRALSKSIDVVIAENHVFKTLPRILGREFYKKKKFPLGIPGRGFKDRDLGEQILYALQKSVLHISMKGQSSTMVVGHDNLDENELTENISKIANWLKRKFPGGWRNIQKLAIHTGENGIPPLVVYFSTGSANDIKKPPVTRGGSIPDPIEGEVSTQPASRIKVHATGEIEIFEDKNLSLEDRKLLKQLEIGRQEARKNLNKQKEEVKKEEPEEVKKEEPKEVKKEEDDEEVEMEESDDEEVEAEEEMEAEGQEGDEEEMSDDDEDESDEEEDE